MAPQDARLQAFNFRGGRGQGAGRPFRGRGGAPFSRAGRGTSVSARGAGASGGEGRKWYPIYCGKCKGEGKPEAVFSAHKTVDCPSLASLELDDRKEMIHATSNTATDATFTSLQHVSIYGNARQTARLTTLTLPNPNGHASMPSRTGLAVSVSMPEAPVNDADPQIVRDLYQSFLTRSR